MAEFLKRASGVLAIVGMPLEAAFAAQGPGVGNGTATASEQIWLAVGVFAALLTAVVLARRSRS